MIPILKKLGSTMASNNRIMIQATSGQNNWLSRNLLNKDFLFITLLPCYRSVSDFPRCQNIVRHDNCCFKILYPKHPPPFTPSETIQPFTHSIYLVTGKRRLAGATSLSISSVCAGPRRLRAVEKISTCGKRSVQQPGRGDRPSRW